MSRATRPSPQAWASAPETSLKRLRSTPRGALLTVFSFSVLPFAGLLNANKDQGLGISDVLPYLIVVLAAALLVLLAVQARWGPAGAGRAAVVVAVGLFWFFNYHATKPALGDLWAPVVPRGLVEEVWALLLVLTLGAAYILAGRFAVRRYVLIVGALLAILPLAQYAWFRGTSEATGARTGGERPVALGVGAQDLPNVYFFLLDGYGRNDQLAKHLGFDNRPFTRTLSRLGLHVDERAVGSYPFTHQAMASRLEMRYLVTKDEDLEGDIEYFHRRLAGDNATVRSFKDLGYRYVLAPPGSWDGLKCSGIEDLCIEPRRGAGPLGELSEADWVVLRLTPLADALSKLAPGAAARPYNSPDHTIDRLERSTVREPYFLYSHMLSPHPPNRFKPDCAAKDFRELRLDAWIKSGYLDNLRCVNKVVLATVARIRRHDPQAIVIVQGDHGPAFDIPIDQKGLTWTEERIRQRFSVLSAIRLPARCRESLPRLRLVVNTFRVVFACLREEPLKPLPDRAYVTRDRDHGVARVPHAGLQRLLHR